MVQEIRRRLSDDRTGAAGSSVPRRLLLLGPAAACLAFPAAGQGALSGDVLLPGNRAAFVARPAGSAPAAGVVVLEDGGGIHGLAGTMATRLAEAGYLAIAPALDLGTDAATQASVDAALEWLGGNGADPARLGITGFGVGGRAAWLAAARRTTAKAAVAWSAPIGGAISTKSPHVPPDLAAELTIPMLGLYGKADPDAPRAALLRVESRALAAGKVAEMVSYVGSGRGFAAGQGADAAAALDGWQRMLGWFKRFGAT